MGRTVSGVSASEAKDAVSNKFPVYPAGEYVGEIVDIKQDSIKSAANKGKPTLNIQVKFTESSTGEGIGKKFTAFGVPDFPRWASDKVAFLFYQFYKALGVEFPEKGGDVELPDLDDLWGQEIGVRLTVEEKEINGKTVTDDEGEPVLQNRVGGFFPASKGIKATAAVDKDEFTL